MSNEQLAQMFNLVEKAKMMEKIGKEDTALELYLEIHEKYYPNTSFLFERPALLLEKRRRFEEAAAICEKAIQLIENNQITGTKEPFQKRLNRIHEKMGIHEKLAEENKAKEKSKSSWFKMPSFDFLNDPPKNDPPKEETKPRLQRSTQEAPQPATSLSEKTAPQTPPQTSLPLSSHASEQTRIESKSHEVESGTHRPTPASTPTATSTATLVHSTSPTQNVSETATEKKIQPIKYFMSMGTFKQLAVVFGAAIVLILVIMFVPHNYENEYYKDLNVDLSAFYEDSGKDVLKDKPFKNEADENLPEITAEMVSAATHTVKTNVGVIDASIAVKSDGVGLFVRVDPTLSSSDAEKIGLEYAKALSQFALLKHPKLAVGESSVGGLYDYYNAVMVVGSSEEDIKAYGGLIKKQDQVRWKKQ